MTSKQAIALDGGTVYGPYTPGVRVGDSLWLSGQIAPDAGDPQAQVAGALAKIDALLAAVARASTTSWRCRSCSRTSVTSPR